MKKLLYVIYICVLVLPIKVHAAPEISAPYACLMVAETGEVVYEYNGNETHPMASTTKIMTALLALEEGRLDDVITISRNASMQEGSSAYLAAGEKISLNDLLYGLMLNSGNDAAVAVAEYISGDEQSFAERMTVRAGELGAKNTSFENASGLDGQNHYTTATDLAKITSYALKNSTFANIVSTVYKEVQYSGGKLYFSNHNKLLKTYDGCVGVKTGFTKKTGRCLVSAASRNGCTLVCVTLNAPDDWNDHKKLLDYGFSQVQMEDIILEGQVMKSIPTDQEGIDITAVAERSILMPLTSHQRKNITVTLHTLPRIPETISKGEKIGEAEIYYKDTLVDVIDLYSGTQYLKQKTVLDKLLMLCKKLFGVMD